MAKINPEVFKKVMDHYEFELQRKTMLLGGVVSFMSYWAITQPEKLEKIISHKAKVDVYKSEKGKTSLCIRIPLNDGSFENLNVYGDLEEGDVVDISSIIVLFIDKPNGKTIIRYSAMYLEESDRLCSEESIRANIIHECQKLMDSQQIVSQKIKESPNHSSPIISKRFLNVAKKAQYKKGKPSIRGPLYDLYEEECSYNNNSFEEDNWDAMTDGMYGDYPEEGFDGDYEFIGS